MRTLVTTAWRGLRRFQVRIVPALRFACGLPLDVERAATFLREAHDHVGYYPASAFDADQVAAFVADMRHDAQAEERREDEAALDALLADPAALDLVAEAARNIMCDDRSEFIYQLEAAEPLAIREAVENRLAQERRTIRAIETGAPSARAAAPAPDEAG